MTLTESQREAAFPVTIDLGRKMSDNMPVSPMEAGPMSKPKDRMVYPTLYIDSVPGLQDLPEEGCVLIKFRRKSLTIRNGSDGEDSTGAELEVQSICLPEDMGDGATLEDAFKKLKPGKVAADAADYAEPAGEEEE